MLVPRKREMDLFDDMFSDPFFTMKENHLMKTDIKELDGEYEIAVDLPGYNKEDINLEINNGYLNITAKKNESSEEKHGKYLHKERFYGECSRSFYIGDDIKEEDIKAKFNNGTLRLSIPKEEKKLDEGKKTIAIE